MRLNNLYVYRRPWGEFKLKLRDVSHFKSDANLEQICNLLYLLGLK